MAVRWSSEAREDLNEAGQYFYDTSDDPQTATNKHRRLVQGIRALALDPLRAQAVPGGAGDLRKWLIDGYLIYFFRIGSRTIYVVRVYPARGLPLESGSI